MALWLAELKQTLLIILTKSYLQVKYIIQSGGRDNIW